MASGWSCTGPPNSGKSSLFNALSMRDGAIVSPRPGTTRDVIEMPLAIDGVPFLLVDTAGIHETEDDVEAIGIARAQDAAEAADLRLWLGGAVSAGCSDVLVDAMCDRPLPRPLAGIGVHFDVGDDRPGDRPVAGASRRAGGGPGAA